MIHWRKAGKADLRSLYALDQVCFPAAIAYTLREFRALLASSRTIAVLAEEGTVLAGFAIAQTYRATAGHLITIDVAPAFRRRGIGRLLIGHIEQRLLSADASCLRLEVAETNSGASEFYRGLGFAEIGRISNYYQGSVDAIVMEKSLVESSASIL